MKYIKTFILGLSLVMLFSYANSASATAIQNSGRSTHSNGLYWLQTNATRTVTGQFIYSISVNGTLQTLTINTSGEMTRNGWVYFSDAELSEKALWSYDNGVNEYLAQSDSVWAHNPGCGNTHIFSVTSTGFCGASSNGYFVSPPTTDLCPVGSSVTVSPALDQETDLFWWKCESGPVKKWCSANRVAPVNGECGSSAGTTQESKPTNGLCTTGNASTVSETGNTYSWSCSGINGETSESCTANKAQNGNNDPGDNTIGGDIFTCYAGSSVQNLNTQSELTLVGCSGNCTYSWSSKLTPVSGTNRANLVDVPSVPTTVTHLRVVVTKSNKDTPVDCPNIEYKVMPVITVQQPIVRKGESCDFKVKYAHAASCQLYRDGEIVSGVTYTFTEGNDQVWSVAGDPRSKYKAICSYNNTDEEGNIITTETASLDATCIENPNLLEI